MSRPIRVKLDENLGRSHAALFAEIGVDADRFFDQGLSGSKDSDLWQKVVAEGRFFVTLDLDLSDVRQFQPGTHPGILLVRGRTKSQSAVNVPDAELEAALQRCSAEVS